MKVSIRPIREGNRTARSEEPEDYLEACDPKILRFIHQSHREYLAGKSRPAEKLLAELRQEAVSSSKSKRRGR